VVPTTALFLNRQLGINKESNISRCLSILISQIWKQPKFFQNNCNWSVRFESSQSFSRIIAAGCVGLALVGTRFVAHFRVVSLFCLNWKVNTSNTRAIWMWFLLYFFFLWY
jgi:hypothetical protein